MKVKVRDTIYDGIVEPVMVILEEYDKVNIANMNPECTKYAQYPEGMDEGFIEDWMITDIN